MAETFTLDVQQRTVKGKQVKALRRQGLVPAVIYGVGGEAMSVSCVYRPLEIALQKAGGTHLISVTVDDGSTHNTLVREVQRDKVKRTIQHVDFMRVDLTKKLRTEVPIVLVGTPKLSSDLQINHVMAIIEVQCLPGDIPEHIEVDIANLTTQGSRLTVADLKPVASVEFIADPHDIIVRIDSLAAVLAVEEEGAAPEVTAMAEPEVVEKGKKEEEEF